FLINYKGCLILVSHDRYFMDKLVDHVFVFEKEKPIKNYPFNYSQFRMFIENEELNQTEEISNKNKTKEKSKTPGKKLSYKEQQELIQLEPQIKELEQKKQELINKLNSGSNNFEELEKWSKQIDDLSNEISIKEMRWLELTELMETE
ncbi:MAG: ABC transporter ATP-binding protein, partial [Cyclobacteriaceae bacterium]|nr:ABC transporter ATP-binding protein [Cyclobacteriaceae bacterium]